MKNRKKRWRNLIALCLTSNHKKIFILFYRPTSFFLFFLLSVARSFVRWLHLLLCIDRASSAKSQEKSKEKPRSTQIEKRGRQREWVTEEKKSQQTSYLIIERRFGKGREEKADNRIERREEGERERRRNRKRRRKSEKRLLERRSIERDGGKSEFHLH